MILIITDKPKQTQGPKAGGLSRPDGRQSYRSLLLCRPHKAVLQRY